LSYNPNKPQPGDFLSLSQRDLFRNYNVANAVFEVDHVPLPSEGEDSPNRGKHDRVSLRQQSSDPTTASDEIAMYSKSVGGIPQVYFRSESDGDIWQATSRSRLTAGLQLEAYVAFDYFGNIIKDKDENELKFNVSSVTKPNQAANWQINFQNNITTDFYFWVVDFFAVSGTSNLPGITNNLIVTAPTKSNAYSNSVTSSFLQLESRNETANITVGFVDYINVQIYTVV